jgi:hypothetical protein
MSVGWILGKIDSPWGYATTISLVGVIGCLLLLRTPTVDVVSAVAPPAQTLPDEFTIKKMDEVVDFRLASLFGSDHKNDDGDSVKKKLAAASANAKKGELPTRPPRKATTPEPVAVVKVKPRGTHQLASQDSSKIEVPAGKIVPLEEASVDVFPPLNHEPAPLILPSLPLSVAASQALAVPEHSRNTTSPPDCASKMRSLGVVAENCSDIEPIIKSLRSGAYTYNKLDRAYVGVPFRMVLVLKTAEDQSDQDAFAKTEGKPITLAATFSQSVEATLRGADFVVDPAGPQRRTATLMNSVEWEWTVTPSRPGNRTLTMDVVANIYLNSPNAIPYQVRAVHQDLEIIVTPFQYVREILGDTGSAIMGLGAVILSVTGMVASMTAFRKKVRQYLRARRRRNAKTA